MRVHKYILYFTVYLFYRNNKQVTRIKLLFAIKLHTQNSYREFFKVCEKIVSNMEICVWPAKGPLKECSYIQS